MSSFSPISAVQMRLDEAGGPVFFTLQQICDALNEAMLMTSALGKWTLTPLQMSIPAGSDLFVLPSAAMMIPQYIVMGKLKYFFTTNARLEQHDRHWQMTLPGMPVMFVLWDVNTLRCFPRPDKDYSATLWGQPYPSTELSPALLQSLDLPPLLQEVLVYKAIAELLEHTHPDLADAYAAKADGYMNKFKVQIRKRQSHNISVFKPVSTRFQVAQSGQVSAAIREGGANPLNLPLLWENANLPWSGAGTPWNQI